jgi:hypothetical protein
LLILVVGLLLGLMLALGAGGVLAEDPTTCDDADCHQGIEDIRAPTSAMYLSIEAQGGCTVCHGGDGTATEEEAGHSGTFYPDPGSVWIADNTCGQEGCHVGYPYSMQRALMNTEAGKIQGNTWSWGIPESRATRWGNYDLDDPDGATPAIGSDHYKAYMDVLMGEYPDVFPMALEKLPSPTEEEILADPKLAGITYQQHDCQRCHVGVKGRSKRGDWRGMGCSACHILYSNEGFYEGGDANTPADEEGHMLAHTIVGTRETGQGLPVETCNSCHNRGKRIGPTFQGFMEFPYGTPFDEAGGKQPPLHTKQYLFIKTDLHYEMESREENPEGRLLCQDCHTGLDMHGDGTIFGTTLAQVEIECTDCHGTAEQYPWELLLGFGEEFGKELAGEPRGVVTELLDHQTFGTIYPVEDGYLLTNRGNPFGNVVRRGNDVIVNTVNGQEFQVPVIKNLALMFEWKSQDAQVAMESVAPHMSKLECYACHADWAPQCYGCHVKVTYGKGLEGTDWVATGNAKNPDGTHETVTSPGKVEEGRSYLRWEEPILGVNGEGRVSPLIPGCQVVYTVIGPDGSSVVHNKIGRTPPNTEGAGPKGQKGMDMAPVQPHSSGRQARTCESCHANPKSLGYGIEAGRFQAQYAEPLYAALDDVDGNLLAENVQIQIQSIPDLDHDWSRIVTEEGEQLMTVGSHWPDSGPLSQGQRTRVERVGVCMGCHQNMADPAFWENGVIVKYGEVASTDEHIDAMNQVILDAVAADGSVEIPSGPTEEEMAAANKAAADAQVALEKEVAARAAAEEAAAASEAEAEAAQGELEAAQGALEAAKAERDAANEVAAEAKRDAYAAELAAMEAQTAAEAPVRVPVGTYVALIVAVVAVVFGLAVAIAAGIYKLAPRE